MGGRRLGARLVDRCEQLVGADLGFPFGPPTAVFKVGGRIFAIFPDQDDPGTVSLKCDPEFAAALVAGQVGITPGYHLNKRHWITVDLTGPVPAGLAQDLLVDSYDLVVDALPRSRRPLARDRRAAPTRGALVDRAPGAPDAVPPVGMGPDQIAALACALPEVTRSSHQDVVDFRVRGRVFATLPAPGVLALRLAPELQEELLAGDPGTFVAAAGAWGRRGWTRATLADLTPGDLAELLEAAWTRRAPVTVVRGRVTT